MKHNTPRRGFLNRIEKTKSCWLFTGTVLKNGYGQVNCYGKRWRAHRLSYVYHRGPIPNGLLVLHKCDVKNCVKPSHLFLGTSKDNTQDAVAKGRLTGPVGVRNHHAKLDNAKVKAIRKSNASRQALADRYGVSVSTISDAKRGILWRHVS